MESPEFKQNGMIYLWHLKLNGSVAADYPTPLELGRLSRAGLDDHDSLISHKGKNL